MPLYAPNCRQGVFAETPDSPGPLGIASVLVVYPSRSVRSGLHRSGRLAIYMGCGADSHVLRGFPIWSRVRPERDYPPAPVFSCPQRRDEGP